MTLESLYEKPVTKELNEIFDKVNNNQRLSKEDGLRLYKSNDLLAIGSLADSARINRLKANNEPEKIDYVYWINNHHLNLTNICEGKCKFCAYRKKEGENGAFLMTLEDAIGHIETKVDRNIKEIHIVSALNPECDLDYYINLLKGCKKIIPDAHIQALTAVEIDYLAKLSGISVKEVLQELKNAGLGSLPGGGAEVFATEIRQNLCPDKISGKEWLKIMETAHSLGIKSNVTMLTGIGETAEDKIDHMLEVRDVQDRTGGFMAFIPLICHYENTELEVQDDLTGFDIIKNYAISRLMLDNIPHIKAFWIQIGIKMAQISLSFGVDDLDGTVREEKITHSAGAKTGQSLSEKELIYLINKMDKIPVERDTVYNIVRVCDE